MSTEPSSGVYIALLRRQLTLALRRPVQLLNPALFFAIVVVLFPLGLGPAPDTLSLFAGGILWIVALLANMLGAETLFQSDYDDGSLDQLLIAEQPLYFLVMPHLLVQWLLSGVILAILSPLFALMLGLPAAGITVLMASLALGSGVMSVLGAIGAALTVGLRRGGMLIAFLVTPFYMPVLIFGSGAVRAAVDGLSYGPYLAVLGAMFSLALALGPVAIAAALRISADA
ncbi:heme exporter protein CcmB [Congregibacter sp.]|uniref:heme exporter protein CcmB n=1 Tax=Congregibacter sp. TaxID=2744308 RepID=UPI003F6CA25B